MLAVFLLCGFGWAVQAETTYPPYDKPKLPLMSIFTEMPTTAINTLKYSFTKESIPAWSLIFGTTALTYHYDDRIYEEAKRMGRNWGLGNDDKTKTVVEGFGFDLVRLPSDAGSAMYFLGDGWTHFGAAAAFLGTGYFTDSVRPFNTGVQIVHGMILSTFFNQALKRSTGRESPNKATMPRGQWRPFPNVKSYQSHTAEYDAFPSGHIMTATLVFTIINNNYPEYAMYTVPLEVLWLTALGFQMVNNGVHWASDYPLGIAMGYAVAKMTLKMGEKYDPWKKPTETSWLVYPSVSEEGPLINAMFRW